MADFNAIAAVSRTLRRLLTDRIATGGVTVTLAPPDILVGGINGQRLNLYLFQVEEAANLQNQNVPGREHPGTFGQPPLALTLRYLMTSHARTDDTIDSDVMAQSLLGDAMLALHDFGGRIEELALVTNRVGAIGDRLLDPVLHNEFERVKVMLKRTEIDDLGKLWSAMPEANFRRSIVYEASVIQIEGRRPRRAAPPVEMRRLGITVARAATITDAYVLPAVPGGPLRDRRIGLGETLVIEHGAVQTDRLYVRLGNLDPIRVPLPTGGRIELPIPDAQYPIDLDNPAVRPIPADQMLQPGAMEVVLLSMVDVDGVEGGLDRGLPFVDERALASNTMLMQLVPAVAAVLPANGNAAAIIRITGQRLWAEMLPTRVLIGGAAFAVRPPVGADPWAAPTPTAIEIPASIVAAALEPDAVPYPLAVEVNGARNREVGLTFRLDP